MSSLRCYFLAVLFTGAALAQPAADQQPDIEIHATVKARSVKFEQVPNVQVKFSGDADKDARWEGSRKNLPRPVKPGVTYRNVSATTSIRATFREVLNALQTRP
jgi:hypothetical protein